MVPISAGKFDPRVSLAEWVKRLAYRRRRLALARRDAHARPGLLVTHEEADRIHKWERNVQFAERTVATRRAQSVSVGERALRVARTLLDVRETSGNNWGGKVTEIIKANGGVGPEPWCGDFVAYIFRLAGAKAVSRGWAWVPGLKLIAGLRRKSLPRPGYLVVFNWNGGDEDHVGIVEDTRHWMIDGTVQTIEGNTKPGTAASDAGGGEGVYRRTRSRDEVAYFLEVLR